METDRAKTPFEVLQSKLTIEDTLEFREKHLPEILEAMTDYAKEVTKEIRVNEKGQAVPEPERWILHKSKYKGTETVESKEWQEWNKLPTLNAELSEAREENQRLKDMDGRIGEIVLSGLGLAAQLTRVESELKEKTELIEYVRNKLFILVNTPNGVKSRLQIDAQKAFDKIEELLNNDKNQ